MGAHRIMNQADKKSLLYFSSKHCSVCHGVRSELMEIALRTSTLFEEIDVEKQPERAGQNQVFTVPTVVVLDQGKEIFRQGRFFDFVQLENILKEENPYDASDFWEKQVF